MGWIVNLVPTLSQRENSPEAAATRESLEARYLRGNM